MTILRIVIILLLISISANATHLDSEKLCLTLHQRITSFSGNSTILLRSYDVSTSPQENAITNAAFLYDNSLAVIALLSCDRKDDAERIGLALLNIAHSNRLYNAYREGIQENPPLPNGWWDKKTVMWQEDDYQVSIATGNIAWAGLALLHLQQATNNPSYGQAARRLGRWLIQTLPPSPSKTGFPGGFQKVNGHQQRLYWISTEHNADLSALFAWLSRDGNPEWLVAEKQAYDFLLTQWNSQKGHFSVGTLPDGATTNENQSGIDSQTFPLLLTRHEPDWNRAITRIETFYAVGDGFDFNDDRDGIWLEGTAQVALIYQLQGKVVNAEKCLALIAEHISPNGLVFASSIPRLTTGLALSPNSSDADFFYYRWPHLGATAWAILAAKGKNPMVGE